MTEGTVETRPVWGFASFIFGVIALIAVTLSLSDVFTQEQEVSTATAIGEFAAEIRQSAQRALSGEEAPPPAPPPDRFDVHLALVIVVSAAGGIAALLGAIGLFRREPSALAGIGMTLGIGAFVMQYLFWLALIIGGIVIIVAIINNIEGILGG